MIEVRQTDDFLRWFADLRGRTAKARIDVRIRRLLLGSPCDVGVIGDKATQEKDIRLAKFSAKDLLKLDMGKAITKIWDPAEHLVTEADMAAYLEAALQEDDSHLIAAALGDMARAKGMTQIARETGLGRESLYKALSPEGNAEFATIMKVIAALGLELHATPSN